MMRRRQLLASAAAALAAGPARALGGRAVAIGLADAISSLDPHFYNATPNHTLAVHLFDRLVDRDAAARPVPGLALSWQPAGDSGWDFTLRPGVRWHDGAAFTADDVAFTVERARAVPNSPGGFAGMLRAIVRVEVLEPLRLRLHTYGPAPTLPRDLALVHIVSRHVGAGATTADYNAGRAAIGTGPYRLVRNLPGDRVELARNDAWWGAPPAWTSVTLRTLPNPAARSAALLAGDVDLIDQPALADLPRLRSDPAFAVAGAAALRVIRVQADFSHPTEPPFVTDNAGQRLARNPLNDVRVRRALTIAINRTALVERVMQGNAVATGQWMLPGSYSYAPDLPVPRFDPEGARALLAKAGYRDGFRLTLHGSSDRFPGDAATAQAIAQMWTRVGVRTAVETMPFAAFAARVARQEFSMALAGASMPTGEAGSLLVNVLATYNPASGLGAGNAFRYSNADLDGVIEQAARTVDDAARERLLIDAETLAMTDVAFMPLYNPTAQWACRAGFRYAARADELTLAMSLVSAS
jgi:peptide/nickel transport system substrate-binding protein